MEIVVGGEKLYSQNLRDFLRIKEEDHQSTPSSSGGGRRSFSGITLSAILSDKRVQPPPVDEPPLQHIQSNRTLLDIICEDQTPGLGGGREDGRRGWRDLRDKIRLRLSGGTAAWSSAVPIPSSNSVLNDNSNRMTATTTGHPSTRLNSNINSGESTQHDVRAPSSHGNPSRATERASRRFEQSSSSPRRRSISEGNRRENGEEEEGEMQGEDSPEQPVRTSLMSLLAENDTQMGHESSAYDMDDEEETVASVNGVEYNSCCVCMVRHKGAAFIPCGHTFCRLCSRELWVQRGNCPLCNNHILEILDIF